MTFRKLGLKVTSTCFINYKDSMNEFRAKLGQVGEKSTILITKWYLNDGWPH